ncbi:hypothetical protein [Shewanella sp. S23-S33]
MLASNKLSYLSNTRHEVTATGFPRLLFGKPTDALARLNNHGRQ